MADDVYFEDAPVSRPVTVLSVPRPLPSVPCLTYDGRTVRWDPWKSAPRVLCSNLDQSCEACAFPGPLSMAFGMLLPHEGETYVTSERVGVHPSGRPKFRGRRVPSHAFYQLSAHLCPRCLTMTVIDMGAGAPGGGGRAVESILCDGCDVLCGVGVSTAEARVNLSALGGWSASGADWDLCPSCNPARNPSPPPRALAALRGRPLR